MTTWGCLNPGVYILSSFRLPLFTTTQRYFSQLDYNISPEFRRNELKAQLCTYCKNYIAQLQSAWRVEHRAKKKIVMRYAF